MWDLIVSVPDDCLPFYFAFFEGQFAKKKKKMRKCDRLTLPTKVMWPGWGSK